MTFDPETQLSDHFKLGEFLSPNDPDGVSYFNSSPVTYTARLKELCVQLEIIRNRFGPVHIDSGLRSPAFNASLPGSAPKSQHMEGRAADIVIANVSPSNVANYAHAMLGLGGVGTYETFTHVDVRPRDSDGVQARWNG